MADNSFSSLKCMQMKHHKSLTILTCMTQVDLGNKGDMVEFKCSAEYFFAIFPIHFMRIKHQYFITLKNQTCE